MSKNWFKIGYSFSFLNLENLDSDYDNVDEKENYSDLVLL